MKHYAEVMHYRPHWVLAWYQDYPDDMVSCRNMHVEMHYSRVNNLNKEYVNNLADWIDKSGILREASEILAENFVCEYVEDIERFEKSPRNSIYKKELETIRIAAEDFINALEGVSGFTREKVHQVLRYPWEMVEIRKMLVGYLLPIPNCDKEKALLDVADLFFGPSDSGSKRMVERCMDLKIINYMKELVAASRGLEIVIPDDLGGPLSGFHDSSGSMPRLFLASNVRQLLRDLGLPFGAQKYGPVSEFLSLVHQAATGEVPSWADRYAAKTPRMEKEALARRPQGQ